MKIVLSLVIEIPDPGQWTTAYGVEGAAAIRQDVKDHIGQSIAPDGSLAGNGEIDMSVEYH